MIFPADIKGCMKDCNLSLFWLRKDIVAFFEKHGCSKAELIDLNIEGENCIKRHEIIERHHLRTSDFRYRDESLIKNTGIHWLT